MNMDKDRYYNLSFPKAYDAILGKVTRKGHQEAEMLEIVRWLTGYSDAEILKAREDNVTYGTFFMQAPSLNPGRFLITGSICGYKVQEIEDPVIRDMRCLDKMIDELVHDKPMAKILRKA